MSTNVLLTEDLATGYGHGRRACALHHRLNLRVQAGEVVALLGPNGAGKSTLLRTLAGLQPALAGAVRLQGQPVAGLPPARLARMRALVLGSHGVTGSLRAEEAVALGRAPYTGWMGTLRAQDHAQVAAAMALTGASHLRSRALHTLSDGERQKVLLARALAQDTPLVLLDEPTAHLDLPSRLDLLRLLHRLARETGKAFVVSTHELDLALQAADQAWLVGPQGQFTACTPEAAVLDGHLTSTFGASGTALLLESGTPTLFPPSVAEPDVVGHPDLVLWTRRALRRAVPAPHVQDDCRISADYTASVPVWQLHRKVHPPAVFTNLAALVRELHGQPESQPVHTSLPTT